MEIDLNYLEMCIDTYRNLERTKRILEKATTPILTDTSLIDRMCDMVREQFGEKEKLSVVARAQIFVVLYLYEPSKLLGKNCSHSNILNMLKKKIGYDSTIMSKYKDGVVLYYKVNKSFRHKVDEVMARITDELLS